MKKATPNRFLNAGRPGVLKVKMSLGRAMKTTDLNGGLNGGFGTLGPASALNTCLAYKRQQCSFPYMDLGVAAGRKREEMDLALGSITW